MLRLLFASLLLTISPILLHAEDLAALLNYVPKDANVVMAVDLKSLMASPVAIKEGWKQKVADETMIGILPFPDTAEYAVVAELLQPSTLQGKWELVLISTSKPYSMQDIAKAEKAEIETIGNITACFTRRNTVILQLSPTLLGIYSPAHRQDVARWLKSQMNKPQLAAPLAKIADVIKAGNQVALIFDFEDTLEVNKVRQFVAAQKEVHEKKLNVDALSKIFSSLRTVTFTIHVDQESKGTMKVEFAQELAQVNTISTLVLNAFEMIGANVDEYRKGTLTNNAKEFELQTTLTPAGFRNTIGMVQPNSIAPSITTKRAGESNDANDPVKAAQKTFRSIQNIANNAHSQAEASGNIARAMVIYDNAATRLDKLPLTHVEEDLQRFAADVSRSLREMATELNSAVLEVQALESKIRTDVTVTPAPPVNIFPNPWGFRFSNPFIPPIPQYNVQTNQPEVVAAQLDVINKAVRKRNDIWRALIDKSSALKKTLSAKYGVTF